MRITLSTGQKMEILTIVPTGSVRRGVSTPKSDIDITVLFKWTNPLTLLEDFPLHLHKGDKGTRREMYGELLTTEKLSNIFNEYNKDNRSLDIKFEEVSAFARSIQTRQSVECLEVLEFETPLYIEYTWEVGRVVRHLLFNKEHYMFSLLQRIHSTFKGSVGHYSASNSPKNLSNVLHLYHLYLNQKDKDVFNDTVTPTQLKLEKRLRSNRCTVDLFNSVFDVIKVFISDNKVSNIKYEKFGTYYYNIWLSLLHDPTTIYLGSNSTIQDFIYYPFVHRTTWRENGKNYKVSIDTDKFTDVMRLRNLNDIVAFIKREGQ